MEEKSVTNSVCMAQSILFAFVAFNTRIISLASIIFLVLVLCFTPPVLGGAVLQAQDAREVMGGCNTGACGYWSSCNMKRCYEGGSCQNCTGNAGEFWCDPNDSHIERCQTIVVAGFCGYQAPYGECIIMEDPGLPDTCFGGTANLIPCSGKDCVYLPL